MNTGNPLKSDDGTPLEAKEGVVIDKDGTPLNPPSGTSSTRVFVWKGGWPFIVILGIVIPVLMVAGFAFVAIFLALAILFGVIHAVLRAFGVGPRRF